jgi:putative ABC transport system permease protein
MDRWLQDFAYRILSVGGYLLRQGSLALIMAFITIAFQAAKAGIANPVKSLRAE